MNTPPAAHPDEQTIQAWLVEYLAEAVSIEASEVDPRQPFMEYGLDSAASVILVGDIGEWLAMELEPVLLLDYPDIESLARHLAAPDEVEELRL